MTQCYIKMVWPNFYISGMLKLIGDLLGLVPPLGLSVVVQHILTPVEEKETNSPVTIHEFLNNGVIMVLIITISSIGQAILSQNSTHLVSVEGIRLKTALQVRRNSNFNSVEFGTKFWCLYFRYLVPLILYGARLNEFL